MRTFVSISSGGSSEAGAGGAGEGQEEEGFKTSLRLNEKYKNTIYLSFMDKYDTLGEFEQGKKYKLSFRDLVPNTKGYVNFKLIDYEEIEEVEEFGDLL